MATNRRRGFTLIEVLMATMILSGGLIVLMTSLSTCIEMVTLSKQMQQVQYVLSLGELKYPIKETKDVEEDVPVDPDYELSDGFVFERTVDEKEENPDIEDDGLYIVRTRVSWNDGKQSEEVVQYVRQQK